MQNPRSRARRKLMLRNNHRKKRMAEISTLQKASVYNQVYPLQKTDYGKEVTEASSDAYVLVHLTSSMGENTETRVLSGIWRQLASKYGEIKFCEIRADMCIEGYPERNTPTILAYKDGEIRRQFVTLRELGGVRTKVEGLFYCILPRIGRLPGAKIYLQILKRFLWTWELSKRAICVSERKTTPTTRGIRRPTNTKMMMMTIGIEAFRYQYSQFQHFWLGCCMIQRWSARSRSPDPLTQESSVLVEWSKIRDIPQLSIADTYRMTSQGVMMLTSISLEESSRLKGSRAHSFGHPEWLRS